MNLEPAWLSLAKREIGVSEIVGAETNPRIAEYHKFTSLKASSDEVPWCSSFACWVMEVSGIPSPKSARARSWLDWGVKIDKPTLGCLVVLTRGNSTETGHVGFYVGESPGFISMLGGNQSNRVCVQDFPKVMVIGYRMPLPEYWRLPDVDSDPNSSGLS